MVSACNAVEAWFNRPLDMVIGTLSASFELCLRVAAPIVTVILLIMIAMGFIMKTMPQINVLTIGFAMALLALSVVGFRSWPAEARVNHGTAVTVSAIYWHFLGALWVFLFLLLLVGR
ncbi:MAG: flagellar biosynthetic protein FliR [Acidobacteria bacterium]|nr:flagellar biosynthetic protein FliR [Acidobacteriota bacterium]